MFGNRQNMFIMMLLPMHWVETGFSALCQT